MAGLCRKIEVMKSVEVWGANGFKAVWSFDLGLILHVKPVIYCGALSRSRYKDLPLFRK